MKIVGISMIRNDADIVEPFVRHLVRNDACSTLVCFTEALIRSRPGDLDGSRFEHGSDGASAAASPDTTGADGRQRT